MKKLIIVIIAIFFVQVAYAQKSISIGIAYSFKSLIMNEHRSYMVYLPPSYETSETTYPVIYLLDGDSHRFKGFVGVLESLSTDTLERQVLEAIVVAIPNTDRTRDLTPSSLKEWKFNGRVLDTFEHTGNAGQFANFLQQELIPTIASKYRTSEKRVLVGESFGGLFAANMLLQPKSMFSDYLIIDPTALWDDNYLNRTLNSKNKEAKFNSNVYFAFANNAHLGEIGLMNYKWGTAFASSILAQSNGISKQHYFEDEVHGTVAFMAWYRGLKALLPNLDN